CLWSRHPAKIAARGVPHSAPSHDRTLPQWLVGRPPATRLPLFCFAANPMSATEMKRTTSRTQDIDRHVGARIRERRIMLGLTQQQLADLIGVTYQQAHKYERGINRVSAGRLFEIARVLSVPVSYFF